MLGAEAFYEEYIEGSIITFISHRFEEIARTYFSLCVQKRKLRGISNIGTFKKTTFSDEVEIGQLTDVLDYPGNKVYVVEGEHSYMIPAVKEFVLSTDMTNETMQVKLIEGMRTDES